VASIVLYTRRGCHLCEAAEAMLIRLGAEFETRDIDADPELHARYDEIVPVLAIDGQAIASGIIDEGRARQALNRRG
jgi:glutaredoxin